MSKANEALLRATQRKLMKDKLGPHSEWTLPDIQNHVGPYNPGVFTTYNKTRQQVVAACEEKLAGMADLEILILGDDKLDDHDDIRSEWHSCQRNEINRLQKKLPPWFAGGFGHPDYIADFKYWAQFKHFTNKEALLLSLGVEPDRFTQDEIFSMSTSLEKGTDLWETLRYMLRRRDQIERQFPNARHRNQIDPKLLFDWFELVDLDIHPEFTSRYLRDETAGAPNGETEAPRQPHKREIDSVCQLFVAMVIEYYGYEPGASRSPIPKEIGELAANLGMEISDDTIRKYLKRGANFISTDWKPK